MNDGGGVATEVDLLFFEAEGAGEACDRDGVKRPVELIEGEIDNRIAEFLPALREAVEQGGVKEIELVGWSGSLAEIVAEVRCAPASDVFERGFTVGEGMGVVGDEGQRATWVEDDADEFGEVDGVDLLIAGVDA